MRHVAPVEAQSLRAARFLERSLLLTIVIHALAMLSMALLLMPGIPGGLGATVAQRASYVGQHPWLWRLGWLPWQMTAFSDLLLAIALISTRWIPKVPAVLTLLVTAAGMAPDQSAQFRWTWLGPAIAAQAGRLADYGNYTHFEARAFLLIAGWGTIGYLAGALGWTWCLVAARVWSRRLTWISLITWPSFAAATLLLLLTPVITGSNDLDRARPLLLIVGAANGLCFVLLMIWLLNATEQVLRRSRPDTQYGRYAPFRHPSAGMLARASDVLANARTLRAFGEWTPALAMRSEITDVIYVNYLIDASRLAPLVQAPLQLQRLGPQQQYALFTFLTFRHGHSGPSCLGPLRKLWPSPVQSNWRIHVLDPATGHRGIQFLTIAITGLPYALVARTLAENVPMHIPAEARLSRSDGALSLELTAGTGSAPDAEGRFVESDEAPLSGAWKECFGSWREFLAYCVPQDRALSAQPWYRRVTRQEITLNIPLESCQPMQGTVRSNAARAIAGDSAPLSFLVDRVSFRLLHEAHDDQPAR